MKNHVLVLGLISVSACFQGCLVIVDDNPKYPPPPERPVKSERPIEPDWPHHVDSTIAEIDAVAELNFDNFKSDAYMDIAQRNPLHPIAQAHLARAVLNNLSFDNFKRDVLLVLINNQGFSPTGETAILENLDKISFENFKRDILDAINDRKSR